MSTYYEKLRDPRWQKKRLEVMSNNEFACEKCGTSENTLNVHHKVYYKNRDPWDYEIYELAVLCEECHKDLHEIDHKFKQLLARIPTDGPNDKDSCFHLLAGFLRVEVDLPHKLAKNLYEFGESISSTYWRSSNES